MTIAALNANPTAEDIAIEAQAIGALLFGYPRVSPQILAIADERDYTVGAHRTILEAARRLGDEGRHTDMPAVAEELERAGHLEHVGGAKKLSDLICEASFAANGPHYAAQVAARARRRRVAHEATQLAVKALDPGRNLEADISTSIDSILTAKTGAEHGLVTAADLADEILDPADPSERGLLTGWPNVNRLYRVVAGQMSIITAHSQHGKTTWLNALLTDLAKQNLNARFALWSPEAAPISQHARQLITVAAGKPWQALDTAERKAALAWIDSSFVWVDHDTHDTVDGILAQVRASHDQQALTGFVLDPWTELDATWDHRRFQREDQWMSAELSRIRKFARAQGIHIWVVAHPKNLDKRSDGTWPVVSTADIHGGSVWRKKADFVVSIWRDEAGITRSPDVTDIHVQKVRWAGIDGRMGKTELRFDELTGRYFPIARAVEAI